MHLNLKISMILCPNFPYFRFPCRLGEFDDCVYLHHLTVSYWLLWYGVLNSQSYFRYRYQRGSQNQNEKYREQV